MPIAMSQTTNVPTRCEVNTKGQELVSALNRGDLPAAEHLAENLAKMGAASLERLMPRGTLRFAAGDRWDSGLTSKLVEKLSSASISEALAAAITKVLAYFAGEQAVRGIRGLILDRAAAASPSIEQTRTAMSGLYALHFIGGPQAVDVLREFQGKGPPEIRQRAHWYLNELGSPTVDLQFSSEERTENLTADDVLRRDTLPG